MAVIRKLVTIICEADLESKLGADITHLGAHGYTVTAARGRGAHGVRDASWGPSANVRIEVICEAAVAEQIAAHVRFSYSENYALVLYMMDVEVLRADKF